MPAHTLRAAYAQSLAQYVAGLNWKCIGGWLLAVGCINGEFSFRTRVLPKENAGLDHLGLDTFA